MAETPKSSLSAGPPTSKIRTYSNIKVPPKTRRDTDPVPWNEVAFPETKPLKIPGDVGEDETEDIKNFLDNELPVILGQYEWLRNKEDDPIAPFNSKYSGREKLILVREQICEMLGIETEPPEQDSSFPASGSLRLLHALAIVSHSIGINFIETEEVHSGQLYVDYVIEHFSRHVDTFPFELMDTYNQLGILWSNREEYTKAEQHLINAKNLYNDFVQGDSKHILENQPHLKERAEELYTMNSFFLAQVYGHTGKPALSAEYFQVCLERQLDQFEVLNVVDFAYNCIGLYNYHVVAEQYSQAEYYLHAGLHVINRAKDITPRSKSYTSTEGGLPQATADFHKTWGKFYSHLLRLSWEYKSGHRPGPYVPSGTLITFRKLPEFTLVSSSLATTYDQALKLFKKGEVELAVAIEYYQLDGWVSDHLEILQDLAQMYTMLAHFETDIQKKCKMLERKLNLFEPIINDLNPRVYVENIRTLSFELSETYQALADLKSQSEEEGRVQKMNELCFKAIRFLNMLFKTFEESGSDDANVADAWLPVYISAHISRARLHTKFIHYDVGQQIQEHEVALETYQKVVAFLKRSPSTEQTFADELHMCEEMCALLPLKISAMRAGQ